ncbi:hypothetical protein GGS21DRAFT_329520 [Xylaria nigripes]|nr:hypothetical protein GGS21DRAFT_329520 [Xylaria nigripes]
MHLRGIFVFLSTLAATSTANPLRGRCGSHPPVPSARPGSSGITYVLPISDGPSSLPSPNKTVKHIAVGHGVQNYTCSTAGVQPASIGALAVLYEITRLYPGSGEHALSQEAWDTLTSSVLHTTSQPIQESTKLESPFPPPGSVYVPGIQRNLQFLGHHFFSMAAVPTFSLGDDTEVLSVQKVQGIPAPQSADAGLDNEGAVDWLLLADNKGNDVYRVLTAGGDPAVCRKTGETQSVDYAAMYWIY